jgi:OOP family OmpA-OmpF porin
MRLLTLAILSCLLAAVYWVGATEYTDRIEQDIHDRSTAALAKYQPDVSVSVDGRDVTIKGTVASEEVKEEISEVADSVWGVRKTANQLDVDSTIPYAFNAEYDNQHLRMSGTVDSEDAVDMINTVPNALPPSTQISTGPVQTGAADMPHSAEKIETGVAALTQLNKGRLSITDTNFDLSGVVSDQERLNSVERLIDTRRDVLEPLIVTLDIDVDPHHGISGECREAIFAAMQNNVLNYEVDYYAIEDNYFAKLNEIAAVVTGICNNQVTQVLVEGHADVTGGEGYNQGLSERRAGTVRDYLIGHGVPADMITAFGYGEFRPIASNETEEGKALNRRTEIHLSIEAFRNSEDNKYQLSTNSDD